MCYPLQPFISQSATCNLKNLTSYFNTKEIFPPQVNQCYSFEHPICLALLHSDFTHKKATECNRNLGRTHPWKQVTYFPLHQQECLRQIVNKAPKRSIPCSALLNIWSIFFKILKLAMKVVICQNCLSAIITCDLPQSLANYSPWAKSDPLPVL